MTISADVASIARNKHTVISAYCPKENQIIIVFSIGTFPAFDVSDGEGQLSPDLYN